MPKPGTPEMAAQTAGMVTAGGLGVAAGSSLATTAAAAAAGNASGTVLGYLAAHGALSAGELAFLAAHPVGLGILGAGLGIWGAYRLCKEIFGD